MERHEPSEAVKTLKKALDAVAAYKKEGDSMYKQLSVQEKEIRRIHAECAQKIKANKKKEKLRARAMFGGAEEKKDSEKNKTPTTFQSSESNTPSSPVAGAEPSQSPVNTADPAECEKASETRTVPKKKVSFADGKTPGDVDDDSEPSFFEEHMEALFLVAGVVLGCFIVNMAWKKKS
mmetsp:Transcript_6321/g.10880  ORF Transcript_6321/g.10880 Transcript_6321/m.10880 type:complete len:178 (+) Transcript_6321:128-661(+)